MSSHELRSGDPFYGDDEYLERLAAFGRDAERPEFQPPEMSERASALVIGAIVQYPQSACGADLIIADRLLAAEFVPEASSRLKIGMIAMARMVVPDPESCAQRINRVHEWHGVPYQVSPRQAATTIMEFGAKALNQIPYAAKSSVRRADLPPVDFLNVPVYPEKPDGWIEPWMINHKAVVQARDFLVDHPALRQKTIENIRWKVTRLRNEGPDQRAIVLDRLASHGLRGPDHYRRRERMQADRAK